jgi:hypothetical protein
MAVGKHHTGRAELSFRYHTRGCWRLGSGQGGSTPIRVILAETSSDVIHPSLGHRPSLGNAGIVARVRPNVMLASQD